MKDILFQNEYIKKLRLKNFLISILYVILSLINALIPLSLIKVLDYIIQKKVKFAIFAMITVSILYILLVCLKSLIEYSSVVVKERNKLARQLQAEVSAMTKNLKTRERILYWIENDETVRDKYYEENSLVIFTVEQPGKTKNFNNLTHEFTADMIAVKNKKAVYVTDKASSFPTAPTRVLNASPNYSAIVKQGVYNINPITGKDDRGPIINGFNCFEVNKQEEVPAYYYNGSGDGKDFNNYSEKDATNILIHRATNHGGEKLWSTGCITYYDSSINDHEEHIKFLKAVGKQNGILVIDRKYALAPFANK